MWDDISELLLLLLLFLCKESIDILLWASLQQELIVNWGMAWHCTCCKPFTQPMIGGSNIETRQIWGFDSCNGPSNLTQIGFNFFLFFSPYYLEIRWMNSKNNRAPPLCYVKLWLLFQSHQWIQTGVTVQKCLIQVKIGNFVFCVTLKCDRWPWKIIGHLLLCYFKLCA